MENKIPEFEAYLATLSQALKTDAEISGSICMEVGGHLYDKYNEYLVKGYGLDNSVGYTLKTFEKPARLAGMFNDIYKEGNAMPDIKKFVYNKNVIAGNLVIILLMTVYGFIYSLYNFLILAGKDYGSLGWHAIDTNVINGLLLSTTLLVLYIGSLYNMVFKKLLPPKIIIWTAYINFILVLFFNLTTH